MLKTGFSRVDITPPFGTSIAGYYEERLTDGVLDPLYATAVAFDDGDTRAVVMSLDLLGIPQPLMDEARTLIADTVGTSPTGVYLACTHTHTGPYIAGAKGEIRHREYLDWMFSRLADAASLAFSDLAETQMSACRGRVEGVSFIRRFRMKDGSVRTNPGLQNPDIVGPLGAPDEESQLLILKRKDSYEIGIVNFGVHPDVIGGCKISADYPKFVRDTYESLLPNSRCMFLNGAAGNLNHVDVSLSEHDLVAGYGRAKYMGKKIALSVLSNYELAKPIFGDAITFGQKNIFVKYHKGTPEEVERALKISKIYHEQGLDAATPEYEGMRKIEVTAEAERIVRHIDMPDEKELYLTALRVGDMVFAGYPGEPFVSVGRAAKSRSKFSLTIPSCCSNGYEGYYPDQTAFDEGGYEALTARYMPGSTEKIIEESIALINSL